MGSGASRPAPAEPRRIYCEVNGKECGVEYLSNCNSSDLKDIIASAGGFSSSSYQVRVSGGKTANGDNNLLQDFKDELKNDFCSNDKIEEFASKFSMRLKALERKLEDHCFVDASTSSSDESDSDVVVSYEGTVGRRNYGGALMRKRSLHQYPIHLLEEDEEEFVPFTPTSKTIIDLKSPSYDVWGCDSLDMVQLMEFMFHDLGLIQELRIHPITLRKWLCAVRDNYQDNPFHNFRHSFCVTQMMYVMINICNLDIIFSKMEMALLLIAAACHDLDHPGLSNKYQISAKTELARRYPKSPLENHHCTMTYCILDDPETNIFGSFSIEEIFGLKQQLGDLIMSTDLEEHGRTTQKFKRIIEEGFDYNNEEHEKQLMMMLLKCCDISNEVRPLDVSMPWVERLLVELWKEGDMARRRGLPFSELMDRSKTTKSSAQVGFIKHLLLPTFELMTKATFKWHKGGRIRGNPLFFHSLACDAAGPCATMQLFPVLEKQVMVSIRESLVYYEQLGKTEKPGSVNLGHYQGKGQVNN